MVQAQTKICFRCKKLGREFEKPVSEFYRNKYGKYLPRCKQCRRELASAQHKKIQLAEKTGKIAISDLAAARTVVTLEGPASPTVALWYCMSCGRKSVTRSSAEGVGPPFPTGWRQLGISLEGTNRRTILCGDCSGLLLKAQKIFARIIARIAAHESTETSEGKEVH